MTQEEAERLAEQLEVCASSVRQRPEGFVEAWFRPEASGAASWVLVPKDRVEFKEPQPDPPAGVEGDSG
jgi:hypothetical protein